MKFHKRSAKNGLTADEIISLYANVNGKYSSRESIGHARMALIQGIYLSKALTCMKLFLYKQKLLFIKETDTFGHIVV